MRNHTLDGIRGLLALIVLAAHVPGPLHTLLRWPSWISVWGFFILSAVVLTRSWRGDYLLFLVARVVRLWPIYAICLGGAYLLAHQVPVWSEFAWYPLMNISSGPLPVDLPAWSLCIEARAMLAMPILVWCSRGEAMRTLLCVPLVLLAATLDARMLFALAFLIGAWLARFDLRIPALEGKLFQWLGRISYPLYLSHWLVFRYLPGPIVWQIAVAFAIAVVLTITIERWSIDASRMVWRARPRLITACIQSI